MVKTNNNDIINAKIAVPLKFVSDFWRALEMSLINCEINLIITWSKNCVITEVDRATTLQ